MATAERQRLSVRQYGEPKFDVVDANGVELFEGDIARVITEHHSWLKKGALIRLKQHAQATMGTNIASVPYEDEKRSQSSIRSDEIERVEDGEPIFRKRQLWWRRARLLGSLTKKRIELEEVERELSLLEDVKVGPIVCSNCGNTVGD